MATAMVLLAAALAASAADDPWTKVRELKSGTEIRILKKGAKQALVGKFDEAGAERVVLVVKNEQMAVAKEDVDRLDARPSQGSRVKTESKATTEDPKFDKPPAGPPSIPRQTQSISSGLSVGSKPDFETIYRRPPRK